MTDRRSSSPAGEKLRLTVLFGGQSCEHEVSVTSVRSMLAALNHEKYDVTLVGIDKDGRWHLTSDPERLAGPDDASPDNAGPDNAGPDNAGQVMLSYSGGAEWIAAERDGTMPTTPSGARPDVVFPLLHGPLGEDGTVQGLLELAGVPYVGCGVVGAAVGMDKAMMKRAFRAEGLPLLPYQVITRGRLHQALQSVRREAEVSLGYPMFVKPVSLGSSVGVHRIDGPEHFGEAVRDAAEFDERVMLERAAVGCREIECAVLGNDMPRASVLGEIVSPDGFYDYETKYVDDSARLIVPAELSAAATEQVRSLSLAAFEAIGARGLARADFFVNADDETIYINEINTMPGFTPISMFPRLWAASGLDYASLIDELIRLALEHHDTRRTTRRAL